MPAVRCEAWPSWTAESQTGNPLTDTPQGEDPYSDPINALANYEPQYVLHCRAPDANPFWWASCAPLLPEQVTTSRLALDISRVRTR